MTTFGITGYAGRVGQELLKFSNMVPLACDVRNPQEVETAVRNTKVDIIVHLAAVSSVNKCEKIENQNTIDHTNVRGTFHVATAAEKYNCGMVLLSSVHVFDGKRGSYKEKDKPNPVNYYGWSKFGAEEFRHIFPMKVIRTSYLFDYERLFKHVYPLRANHSFSYPAFIRRSFMYLPHFVEALHLYLMNYDSMPKLLHIAGSSGASWYEFMQELTRAYKLNSSLVEPRNHELDGEVPRPHRGTLNVGLSSKLGIPQFGYKEGILEMKAESS